MKRKVTMLLASLFAFIGTALAQSTVTGTVVSQDDGEPIIGATVQVVGDPNLGTITDVEGKFVMNVPDGKKIKVSYVGMISQEFTPKAKMHVVLVSEATGLDEIMVVAYGTQKKSSFTGSAAEIKADKIEGHIATNVTSALAGTTAGVQFVSSSGDPSSNAATIRVRGIGSISASSAPLYIVDGMPYEG